VVLLFAILAFAVSAQTVDKYVLAYYYESKVKLMDELIQKYPRQPNRNQGRTGHIPYENTTKKFAASIPAGEGPDIINLFYGWLPTYVKAGYLAELPPQIFNKSQFDKNFYPFVAESVQFGGKYYSVPTADRRFRYLEQKKNCLKDAGSHIRPNPPPTLEEARSHTPKSSPHNDAQGRI